MCSERTGQDPNPKPLAVHGYTASVARRLLGISDRTFRRAITAGRVEASIILGHTIIAPDEMRRLLAEGLRQRAQRRRRDAKEAPP